MKFISHLRSMPNYSSVLWHDSAVVPGVRYATRRVSLSQRIELTKNVRELVLRHEFLKSGDAPQQLEGSMADLLARRLYLEWGLVEIKGLTIDGQLATGDLLAERGPEVLSEEIIGAIQAELSLSAEETKNS